MSELSCDELNKRLAIAVGIAKNGKVLSFYQKPIYNFCGSWDLLMPLIIENSISYADRNDGRKGRFLAQYSFKNDRKPPYHEGHSNYTYIESVDDNLQLALAECLLLVLQSKNK